MMHVRAAHAVQRSMANRIIALYLPEIQNLFVGLVFHATLISSGDVRLKQSWP